MKFKKKSHNPYNAKKQKVTTLKKYCQKTRNTKVSVRERPHSFYRFWIVNSLTQNEIKKISHSPYNAKKQKLTTLNKYCRKTRNTKVSAEYESV